MAFDFGAALTSAGDILPAWQAQKQKELEQSQQKTAFDTQQTLSKLAVQKDKMSLAAGIPVRTVTNPDGSVTEVSLTSNGYTSTQTKPARPDYKTLKEGLGTIWGGEDKIPPQLLTQALEESQGLTYKPTAQRYTRNVVPDPSSPTGYSAVESDPYDGSEISRTTASAPAAQSRQPSASVQYMNMLTKKIMADGKQGPPLTPQENAQLAASKSALDVAGIARAEAWAQAAAKNNLVAVTDLNTGMDSLVPRAQAVSAANSGTPLLAGVVSAPTGMDKKNQMLAMSALTQIGTMESALQRDPSLTGPGSGQLTEFTKWIGSNSEDSQQFLAAATFLSEHGVGVFGGRNIQSIEDLQNLMGALKTNPQALRAALEQAKITMLPWATAGGRLPAPRSSAAWTAPADAPPAPKADGKALKADGQVIAKSQGGKWVQP